MQVEAATLADWEAIEAIYREGIRTELATFNTEADIPDGKTWFAEKIPNLIFKGVGDDGTILGWAALTAVSKRRVYAGVAEVSVYVATAAKGHGVGIALLAHLVQASEQAGIWTLQASIFPENEVSVHLHKKAGFRMVGTREKIAQLNGIWRDVVLLERRSQKF